MTFANSLASDVAKSMSPRLRNVKTVSAIERISFRNIFLYLAAVDKEGLEEEGAVMTLPVVVEAPAGLLVVVVVVDPVELGTG